ncbi:unnamed protein product [Rhodiola kirilowii]
MGYLSCNADSAISICNSLITHKKTIKPSKHYSSSKVHDQEQITEFSYSELQIATNNFSTEMFLGKGSHGRVYRAVLRGGKLTAAVKITKGYKLDHRTSPAENEMEILSRVRNPGLVNLIGFGVGSAGEKLIVVEYMPNGTLYDLLHTSKKPLIGWRKRVRLALEIAMALDCLHSANPPVIHRDVKSSNVLLDRKMSARVGDFGLAVRGDVEDERVKRTPPAGTLGYLDPSYLVPGDLSTKSDVFSFGILLLEMMSGRNAIDVNYSPPSIIDWAIPIIKKGEFAAICDRRIGPPADTSITGELAVLASHCVAMDGKRRPEIREVVKWLKEIRKRVRASSSPWSNFTRCVRKQETGSGRQLVVSDIIDNNQWEEAETTTVVVKDHMIINATGSNRIRLESTSNGNGTRHEGIMSRSRSIGSVYEIEKRQVKMRSLNKSRSVGVLYSRNLACLGKEKLVDAVGDHQTGEETQLLISKWKN